MIKEQQLVEEFDNKLIRFLNEEDLQEFIKTFRKLGFEFIIFSKKDQQADLTVMLPLISCKKIISVDLSTAVMNYRKSGGFMLYKGMKYHFANHEQAA